MKILDRLNPSQREAATHVDGPLLILAGAGSGKTSTITARLAYLIGELGIPAQNTLTLTFTNKAATEMRERAFRLLGHADSADSSAAGSSSAGSVPIRASLVPSTLPLLCTFHKFGNLFLRLHIHELGRKNNYSIIDANDQRVLIKELLGGKKIPGLTPSGIAAEFSLAKNSGEGVEDFLEREELISLYRAYAAELRRNNLLDFDDLILLPNELLSAKPGLAERLSRRFAYITVDEYQDTNGPQFDLLRQLTATHKNLCVVGDDDQSIYGWRGARVENILHFPQHFDGARVVKLEENYRSAENILKIANRLISNNTQRHSKALIATREPGEEVVLNEHASEDSEAELIATRIKRLIEEGEQPGELAVLFRVNALARPIEEALARERIAYQFLSGHKFYERAEIKDCIAYLRLIGNLEDDFSLKRIINRPRRGLGAQGLARLEDMAGRQRISLFEALVATVDAGELAGRAKFALAELVGAVKELRLLSEEGQLAKLIEDFEPKFGLRRYYAEQKDGEERAGNISSFYAKLREGVADGSYADLAGLLDELALVSGADEARSEGGEVKIMSVHASKGLEFAHVFLIGMEEGTFPLHHGDSDEEEERRLAYVALTRAKKTLHLSWAQHRSAFYGFFDRDEDDDGLMKRSRFLLECGFGPERSEKVKKRDFQKGDLIKHKIFGVGRVVEKNEDFLRINFAGTERMIVPDFVESAG